MGGSIHHRVHPRFLLAHHYRSERALRKIETSAQKPKTSFQDSPRSSMSKEDTIKETSVPVESNDNIYGPGCLFAGKRRSCARPSCEICHPRPRFHNQEEPGDSSKDNWGSLADEFLKDDLQIFGNDG